MDFIFKQTKKSVTTKRCDGLFTNHGEDIDGVSTYTPQFPGSRYAFSFSGTYPSLTESYKSARR